MKKFLIATIIFTLLTNSTQADDLEQQKAEYDARAQQTLEKEKKKRKFRTSSKNHHQDQVKSVSMVSE